MAATASITRNRPAQSGERGPGRRRSGRSWAAGLVALLSGLLVVGLAVPRLIAGVAILPGNPVLERLYLGEPTTPAGLERLAESREDALAWVDDGGLWHDLGLARLAQSLSLPFDRPEDRIATLQAARAAFRRALALRPLDSHGWLRLSMTDLLLHDRPQAARALVDSLQMASYQPDQFDERIRLGLLLWDQLSGVDRDLWAQQVRLAWRSDVNNAKRLILRLLPAARYRERLAQALAPLPEAATWLAAQEAARRSGTD